MSYRFKIGDMFIFLIIVYTIISPFYEGVHGGVEYVANRIIPQVIAGLFVLIGMMYAFMYIGVLYKQKLLMAYMLFYLLNIFYYLFVLVREPFSIYDFSSTLKVLYWLGGVFVFYICILKNNLSIGIVKIFVFVYIVMAFYQIYVDYNSLYQIEKDVKVSNASYNLLMSIPLVLLIQKGRSRSILLMILLFGILIALKRGPIIIAICVMPIIYRYYLDGLKKIDYMLYSVLLLIVLMVAFNYVGDGLMSRFDELLMGSETMGSGRNIFYVKVVQGWYEGDIIKVVLGNGVGSIYKYLEEEYGLAIESHNGYLDMLYVYGLFGLFIYIRIFLRLLELQKYMNDYSAIIKTFIIIWFLQNMLSYGFNGTSFIVYSIFIAYVASDLKIRYECIKKNNNTCYVTI